MSTFKGVTYTLAYYYGHNLSPVVYYDGYSGNIPQFSVRFDRQHILGFSFNYFEDRITQMVYRGEFALYPNKPYNTFNPWEKDAVIDRDLLSTCLGIDKMMIIPFLHPEEPTTPFIISAQVFTDILLDSEKDLHVPTYLTEIEKLTVHFTLKIDTEYFYQQLVPSIIIAYDTEGDGIVMPSIQYKPNWDERWWVKLTYGNYFGDHYDWLGLWKDQDSLWLQTRFMW